MAQHSGGEAAAGCDNFSSVNKLLPGNGWKNAAQAGARGITRWIVSGNVTRISRR
jgi:hypothetical protein